MVHVKTTTYVIAVSIEYKSGMVPTKGFPPSSRYCNEDDRVLRLADSGSVPPMLFIVMEKYVSCDGNEVGSVPVKLSMHRNGDRQAVSLDEKSNTATVTLRTLKQTRQCTCCSRT